LLRARRERNLSGGDLVTLADDARDLGTHLLDGDVEGLEDARGEAFLFAQQPQQDVLGADVVVLESPRLVLGKDDHLPCPFGESFEQPGPFAGEGSSYPSLRRLGRAPLRTPYAILGRLPTSSRAVGAGALRLSQDEALTWAHGDSGKRDRPDIRPAPTRA